MARYIDADKLQEEFNRAQISIHHHGREFSDAFYHNGELATLWYRVEQMLGDIPTADVAEVRHGEWIEEQAQHVVYRLKNRAFWVKYTCPFCGKKNGRYKSNYCPNCGARMDGGNNDQTN